MNEAPVCPKCGAELPPDAPSGLCPKCLVQAGLESEVFSDPRLNPTVKSPASSGFEPPAVEELAQLFPQLEILELLGKGGMGAVYKARQRGLDRFVALKILPPEVGHDPAFAERFTREARALARLSHPHVVGVYDFGQVAARTPGANAPGSPLVSGEPQASGEPAALAAGALYYFLMEYVDGANLRQTMQAGRLKPEEALAIVPQICDALQYAHDEGVVHRDIKPENILLDTRGRVKIADFGLSKLMASGGRESADVSLTGTHQVMGTIRYMAPEQMQGTKSVDHRADIYSLGVVFYELLTGDLPMGRFDPPSRKVQVDVRLDEVVLRALEQEPGKRYQQVSGIKSDVETISTSSMAAATPVPAPQPTAPDAVVCRRMTWFIAALWLVWTAVLGGLHWGYVSGAKWYFDEELPYKYLSMGVTYLSLMLFAWLAYWWYLLAKYPDVPRSFSDFWKTCQTPDRRARRMWVPGAIYFGVYIVGMVAAALFGNDDVQATVVMLWFVAAPPAVMAACVWAYGRPALPADWSTTKSSTDSAAGNSTDVASWTVSMALISAFVMFLLAGIFVVKGDVEKMENFPAPNNVIGLLACGCAIACGISLLAAAIAGRHNQPVGWLSPQRLRWVFAGAAVFLVVQAVGVAFKDPPAWPRRVNGEVVAIMPNNVDGLAALGFVIAAGLAVTAAVVVGLGSRNGEDQDVLYQAILRLARRAPALPTWALIVSVLGAASAFGSWLTVEVHHQMPGREGHFTRHASALTVWPGVAAAVTFAALGLLLLATSGMRPAPRWRAVTILVGGCLAILFVGLYQPTLESAVLDWHIGGENMEQGPTVRDVNHQFNIADRGRWLVLTLAVATLLLGAFHLRSVLAERPLNDGPAMRMGASASPPQSPSSPFTEAAVPASTALNVQRGKLTAALCVWTVLILVAGVLTLGMHESVSTRHWSVEDRLVSKLIPGSKAYAEIGVVAQGRGTVEGHRTPEFHRRELMLSLRPLPQPGRSNDDSTLTVALPSLGYRCEVGPINAIALGQPSGLDADVILEWMQMAGVDVQTAGVAEEAQDLAAFAARCYDTPTNESLPSGRFDVVTGDIHEDYGSFAATYWRHWLIAGGLWLAGCVLAVRTRHRWAGDAPQTADAPQTTEDPSGFVCAIIAVVVFALGLIVPPILLALVDQSHVWVAAVTFALSMVLAAVFGVLGYRYRLGRITVRAVLVMFLLAGLFLVERFFQNDPGAAPAMDHSRAIAPKRESVVPQVPDDPTTDQ